LRGRRCLDIQTQGKKVKILLNFLPKISSLLYIDPYFMGEEVFMIKEFLKIRNIIKREMYILILIRTNYKKGGQTCEVKHKNPRIYIGKLKITNRFTKQGEENGYSKN